mmetsp:Transcript_19494/g.58924  ORF Transcript_19494/g.58924 Transcript_19494/m.58924 type:complete len:232 (-) Transcript_19494:1070-1765(-)
MQKAGPPVARLRGGMVRIVSPGGRERVSFSMYAWAVPVRSRHSSSSRAKAPTPSGRMCETRRKIRWEAMRRGLQLAQWPSEHGTFSSEQLDSGGIVLEFDVLPRHTLRLVLGLLEAKGIRVELCLQHLVGKVYAELFERVGLKGLEAKDIEDANEGRLDGLSALFGKRRRHGSTVSTCCGCGQLVGSGRTDELIDACDDGIKGAPVDGLSKGARRVRGLCGVERLDVHFAR